MAKKYVCIDLSIRVWKF